MLQPFLSAFFKMEHPVEFVFFPIRANNSKEIMIWNIFFELNRKWISKTGESQFKVALPHSRKLTLVWTYWIFNKPLFHSCFAFSANASQFPLKIWQFQEILLGKYFNCIGYTKPFHITILLHLAWWQVVTFWVA